MPGLMNNIDHTKIQQEYRSLINNLKPDLSSFRAKNLEKFSALGFPSIKHDKWKYTNLHRFNLNQFSNIVDLTQQKTININSYFIDPLSKHNITCLNGSYLNNKNTTDYIIRNLNTMWQNLPDDLQNVYHVDDNTNAFSALNNAFHQSGIYLQIPKNKHFTTPIYLNNYTTDLHQNKHLLHTKNIICVEENSSAIIIEHYNSNNPNSLLNATSEITLKENATLQHYIVQTGNTDNIQILNNTTTINTNADYKSHIFGFNNTLNKLESNIILAGQKSNCEIKCLSYTKHNQSHDVNIDIQHMAPQSTSYTLTRGVATDKSICSFAGNIIVGKQATNTKADLQCKNLLLSDHATANARPQLTINNGDIQCAHGATIGHLDLQALFYMQSRGIPLDIATTMLLAGFVSPVTQNLIISNYIESLLYGK